MKFAGNLDYSNASKDIRKILEFNMKNSIEGLVSDYGIDAEVVEGLSYNLYVKHTQKAVWKGGKTEFTKAYTRGIIHMIDFGALDFDELGFMLYLSSKYTNMEDNYLRINGELVGKYEVIQDYMNTAKNPISQRTMRRKFKSLEDKNCILTDKLPSDGRKTAYYISPVYLYKGRYIDEKARLSLLSFLKNGYDSIKEAVENGELDIKLNKKFERMNDYEILALCAKYLITISDGS